MKPTWSTHRGLALAVWLALVWLVLSGSAVGCVRVYQPLSGLHRPVVVDPQLANFEDVQLTVRCLPGGMLNPQEAGSLCRKVGVLFENQGARVSTTTEVHESPEDTGVPADEGDPGEEVPAEDGEDTEEGAGDAQHDEPDKPDTALTLELRAREVGRSNNLLSWLVCLSTFTAIPAVTESRFAQDVVIRDNTGFLLVSESLEGRLVLRFGLGTWISNKLLDVAYRDEEDKITGDAVNQDLSTDLYRQMSQLLFNAKMQWQVLEQVPSRRAK